MQLIAHKSIDSVLHTDWSYHQDSHTPFTRYEFHQCLEHSGCVGGDTGWQPLHLELVDLGKPVVLIPGYLKSHSWGEYVFDFAWAEAHERYQRPYYPKLVAAVPFTPCAGPRLLLAPDAELDKVTQELAVQLPYIAQEYGFHSWHWLFAQQQDWSAAKATPWHQRLGCQYHWYNQDYNEFADFLGQLSSRKRKNLRKERAQIAKQNIQFNWIEGQDISSEQLQEFFACYANTYHVRGRHPYLNLEFFQLLQQKMPEQIVLMQAQQDSNNLAYAWYFKDKNTLYGRYWGSMEDISLLHFETCYYQGIDYCIANQLAHFDAGAQGEHKLARGFIPQVTHSYHWLQEAGFNQAIDQFCQEEAEHINKYMQWADTKTPYRT